MPFTKERILVKILYLLKGHCNKKLSKKFPSKRYN